MQTARGSEPPQGPGRGLVALVIGMGMAIVLAVGLVVYGLIAKSSGGAGALGFEALDVPLPAGCVIADSRLEGERVLLRLDGLAERGCQQVLLVDLASGEVTARITARPEE